MGTSALVFSRAYYLTSIFRYVYRLSLGMDGCHSFPKKHKNDDVDDEPLGEGQGYFPPIEVVRPIVDASFKDSDDQVVR